MRTTSRLAAVGLVITLAACGSDGSSTTPTATGPLTLRIGTAEAADSPTSGQVREFARQVDRLSNGRLRVEPVWEARDAGGDDWDQQAARKVISGDLAMGAIPARSWDTERVTSLRALHAPFLVTSEVLVEQIVTGPVGEQMLAGLDRAGVVGLALLPENLRHPFAYGKPIRGPGDYAGAAVRSPRSDLSYRMFTALGARPDDYPGDSFGTAVETGEVAAAESAFAWADTLHAPTIATGNVTFYPKVNTLVVNANTWKALTGEQQTILRDAARGTRDWAIQNVTPDTEAAKEFCGRAGTVVLASPTDLAALEHAVQPVYTELQQDPQTTSHIDQIRTLKAASPSTTASLPTACGQPH
jgi:TRAP-type C4-dicarboxylate transport system substrate-binding protein